MLIQMQNMEMTLNRILTNERQFQFCVLGFVELAKKKIYYLSNSRSIFCSQMIRMLFKLPKINPTFIRRNI